MTPDARAALIAEVRRLQLRARNADDEARAYIALQPENDQLDHNLRRALELGWLKGTLGEIAAALEIILIQLAADTVRLRRAA